MHKDGLKKLLDRLGFGWLISEPEKLEEIPLSGIKPVSLYRDFDLGFALGGYSMGDKDTRDKIPVGRLVHKFKYEQNRQAGELLADLTSDFI
jgi:hypothetical protein